ncbi:MAG: polysaccharide biosynthesis protein [Candidatus Limnocylindrales bacterium]
MSPRLEDLLRRAPVPPEADADLRQMFGDESILVTGAAGSIGSELARQLARLRPRQLVLLDRAEGPLFELQNEMAAAGVDTTVSFELVDIVDQRALERVVDGCTPGVIFHAAAYKHVSMMEEHPAAAIEVNVGGTRNVLNAAERAGVRRLVLVSTDKAVEPMSVMGASKRLAEAMVEERSERLGRAWVSVRFGNVLGSSGSVVPIWEKQLAAGLPLTITDPAMTRYFMTVSEAVNLIVTAGALAAPGDLLILDMGEPILILDLARDFLQMHGQDEASVGIAITGLRPGERLHERLIDPSERARPTGNPKIMRAVRNGGRPSQDLGAVVDELLRLAGNGDTITARTRLLEAVAPA